MCMDETEEEEDFDGENEEWKRKPGTVVICINCCPSKSIDQSERAAEDKERKKKGPDC